MAYTSEHVHLGGSVGLPSVEDVFSACGRLLGRRLQRKVHAAGSREPGA